MWQLVFAQASVYGPGDTLGLPVHNRETVQFDEVTHGFGMVKDREEGS